MSGADIDDLLADLDSALASPPKGGATRPSGGGAVSGLLASALSEGEDSADFGSPTAPAREAGSSSGGGRRHAGASSFGGAARGAWDMGSDSEGEGSPDRSEKKAAPGRRGAGAGDGGASTGRTKPRSTSDDDLDALLDMTGHAAVSGACAACSVKLAARVNGAVASCGVAPSHADKHLWLWTSSCSPAVGARGCVWMCCVRVSSRSLQATAPDIGATPVSSTDDFPSRSDSHASTSSTGARKVKCNVVYAGGMDHDAGLSKPGRPRWVHAHAQVHACASMLNRQRCCVPADTSPLSVRVQMPSLHAATLADARSVFGVAAFCDLGHPCSRV